MIETWKKSAPYPCWFSQCFTKSSYVGKKYGSCARLQNSCVCENMGKSASWLTISWWRSLSYRNQSIDLLYKSMDWFLYDRDLRYEKVKGTFICLFLVLLFSLCLKKYNENLYFQWIPFTCMKNFVPILSFPIKNSAISYL